MGLGLSVDQSTFNMKAAQAVLELRAALDKHEAIAAWLANHPVVDAVDPLVTEFGYNADDAYAIRLYFEGVENIRVTNSNLTSVGRKFTGLEP
ncbi:hypothetical protein SEA_HOTFRIES_16 [Streptomyces phage HotFries]|nr:hypothetical protein SEA_HOTFRIES_16 [Streptomyces phage HotFries]AWN05452.1 hypothetical protein SEA_MOOZY_17 [Streptomyces phage Moozy]UQT02464.1 hypothetical protein SEA_ANNIHILUS_17 [Streptomyces phage Annihilus]WMI34397.1 hypothetical protein SEA_SHERA_17 [Streptomyces phage SheRa]